MKINEQSGFSIVSVVIAMGILTGVGVGVATFLTQNMHAMKSSDFRSDRTIIRDYLYRGVSCDKSLSLAQVTACRGKPTTYLPLLGPDGSTLATLNVANPAVGQEISNWWVRASCSKSTNRILVEGKRGVLSADKEGVVQLRTANDPLTNKPEDWKDLFPGMNLCEDQLAEASDFAVPENLSDQKHIVYDQGGFFKAVGGNLKVSIKRVFWRSPCAHVGRVNGSSIPDAYSFTLMKDQTFTFRVDVTPAAGLCTTYDPNIQGPNAIVMQQGIDIYKIQIEDTLDVRDQVTWYDSMWSITSTPL